MSVFGLCTITKCITEATKNRTPIQALRFISVNKYAYSILAVDIVTLRLSCDKNYFMTAFNKIVINYQAKFYDTSYNTDGIVFSVLASE